MKLSISTLACPTWSFPEIVGAASAYALDGIELRGLASEIDVTRLPIFQDEIGATLELLRRHNLEMPCLDTSIALVTPAPERWQMMLDECQRYAQLARRAGAKFIRIFGGAVPREMTADEGLTMARRHLRQLIKVCAPHGCQLLIETHDEWSSAEHILQLLGDVPPEQVGVLWDIEYPFRQGESPNTTVRALHRHIRHVHFKDSRRLDGQIIPCLLGDGELPLNDAIAALRKMEYTGWICLETAKRWHEAAPDPEQSIPQFVEYMRANWPGLSASR